MHESTFNQGLINFLNQSPTPFHAVNTMQQQLQQAGYTHLAENQTWQLSPPGRYFVTRNDSALVAFNLGTTDPLKSGLRLIGAHTDSPCLKVKPNPKKLQHSYWQLGVEVYGGLLLNPWFDRDLSLAGKVIYANTDTTLNTGLVDFVKPIAIIPSLAIHLDREANNKRSINPQTDIVPIILQASNPPDDLAAILLPQLQQQGITADTIIDYELFFYDTQPAQCIGLNNDFIASARLDNLLSCYTGLQSLIAADERSTGLLVCNDHEEVGSTSTTGAQGPLLRTILERMLPDRDTYHRTLQASMLISTDNAHGIHPNYADKHDQNHGPLLNHGPVIKYNANQRYASNAETSAIIRVLAARSNVPIQSFVVRTDMACGSTIGPLTAAQIGVKTIDIGVPTFAMHSIRELAGRKDGYYLYQLLCEFINTTDFQKPYTLE